MNQAAIKIDDQTKLRPAVFLDRDGVINRALVRDGKPYPPNSLAELELTEGALEGLTALKRSGFLLLVITNQPDVTRGTQTRETVEAINSRLLELLPLDKVYTCYHDNADNCACRKPRPGLLLQGVQEWGVDVTQSFLVGDRYKDIEAGQAAGCATILIDYGYSEQATAKPDFVAKSLVQVVNFIEKIKFLEASEVL